MIRTQLRSLLQAAVDSLVASGRLPAADYPALEITDTKQPEHGDYACNFALSASKMAGMNPRQVAELLRESLLSSSSGVFLDVEIAGPGFVNLRLKPSWIAGFVDQVLSRGDELASSEKPEKSLKINVEFVSVNPNGPITIGSGRGAAYGSTLCNVLEAAGHEVHREYYINDGTNSEQMRLFAESVRAIVEGRDVPEQGYKGDYVHEVAKSVQALVETPEIGDWKLPGWAELLSRALSRFTEKITGTLKGKSVKLIDPGNLDESLRQEFSRDEAISATAIPFKRENGCLYYLTTLEAEAKARLIMQGRFGDQSQPICIFSNDWDDLLNFLYEDPLKVGRQAPLAQLVESIFLTGLQKGAKSIRFQDTGNVQYRVNARWAEEMSIPANLIEDLGYWIEACTQESLGGQVSFWLPNRQYWLAVTKKGTGANSEFELGSGALPPERLSPSWFQGLSQLKMLEAQQCDLATFGVTFDTWFSEQSLHDSGKVKRAVDHLIENGAADENPIRHKLKLAKGGKIEDVEIEAQTAEEGGEGSVNTLWLRSTKFGDDMDRVLRRKDGRLTYIASDVAYHQDKFNRPARADKLITILGPDHHGYIGRLHAVLAAQLLGEVDRTDHGDWKDQSESDPERKLYANKAERDACQAALIEARQKLEVQIFQLVRFLKDGKPAPMRKRDGNIFALIDLIDEIGRNVKPNETREEQRKVGKDVARFFYLMRSHETTFDFDLDLAERQSDENPVFYVQYAHARICSVLRKAESLELAGAKAALTHPKELELIKRIADLPYEVQRCAADYGVHRLTTYAIELARTFHHFYDACRVIQEDQPELTRARIELCEAARQGLRCTFTLLGIEAPERMDRVATEI